MSEQERQALAVAANLQGLAKQYTEQGRDEIALALYRSAMEWAKRAGEGEAAGALTDQILRERAALRQEQARQYDAGEATIVRSARK